MQTTVRWMVVLVLIGATGTVSAWWGPWDRGYNSGYDRGYGHYGSGLAGRPYGATDADGEADFTFEFSGWMNMDTQGRGDGRGYGSGYGDGMGQGRYWGAPGYGGYPPPAPHPGAYPSPYRLPPPGVPPR